jgi:alkanesulfonate monooxygenase SsuD/methylene tetrahydromethanopterin reductase-like flavin-dependent oxidoreductase (luciferase family)
VALDSTWQAHPWVTAAANGVRFSLAGGPVGNWPSLVNFVQRAEALGFDAFFAFDHPIRIAGCWTTLAGLAALTRHIRLGTLVNCVAYRSPAELARMAADVDRMSQGRLILGIGVGFEESEFTRLGVRMPSVKERLQTLEDTLAAIERYWSGEMAAGPVQTPRVPVLIAGSGERRTLRQVARFADAATFVPGGGADGPYDQLEPEDIARKTAVLASHCEAVGRPFASVLRMHLASPVVLAPTHERALEKLNSLPTGVRTRFRTMTLAGTPEEIVQAYRPLLAAGMQYCNAFVVGDDTETLELLSKEVIPALRGNV